MMIEVLSMSKSSIYIIHYVILPLVFTVIISGLFDRVRTSSGTFLKRGQDKIIRAIEKRISDFTFIPVGKPQ